MSILISLSVFLVLLIFSVPIVFSLLSAMLLDFFLNFDMPLGVIFHRVSSGLDSFILLSIPFFIFAGNIMNTSGITRKIFKFANTLVGGIPGGLAHANIVASIIFAGMSGSAVADAGGLGAIEMRAMNEEGYDPAFSAAVTAASSTIGPIIPPSVPMVVYAVMSGQSTGRLFAGGFLPGLLMGGFMMILVYCIALKRGYPREKSTWKEVFYAFKEAFLPLMTPVIMIGGILSGVFTPTEGAVVAVVYSLFIGVVVYREIKVRDLPQMLYRSLQDTAVITLIIGAAAGFAWLICIQGIPSRLASLLGEMNISASLFLLIFNVFFLVIGMFMEALSIIVIVVPVLIPVMNALQLDPVHMGVVLVLNLMIGLVTPPIGMSLFVTSKVGSVRLETLCHTIIPFIIPLVLVLFLVTYCPVLVTFLPSILNQ